MNEQDQIKALAELDGKSHKRLTIFGEEVENPYFISTQTYLTSYDAIIPLIQKQNKSTQCDFLSKLYNMYGNNPEPDLDYMTLWPMTFALTPAQLCEALLRATGKWKE